MTYGKYPTSPPAVGSSVTYVGRYGDTITITGVEPDRWSVTSSAYIGEILRDGAMYRTFTQVGAAKIPTTVPDWTAVMTHVYS